MPARPRTSSGFRPIAWWSWGRAWSSDPRSVRRLTAADDAPGDQGQGESSGEAKHDGLGVSTEPLDGIAKSVADPVPDAHRVRHVEESTEQVRHRERSRRHAGGAGERAREKASARHEP